MTGLLLLLAAGAGSTLFGAKILIKKRISFFFIYKPRDLDHVKEQIAELERRPYLS
jgi:hypothetical protein